MAMSGGTYIGIPGLLAGASFAAKQYYVVRAATTAGEVAVAVTPATDLILGVIQNDPADGEPAEVAGWGVCMAAAEASVTFGGKVTCSSTGRIKLTTTDKDEVIGYALKASVSAGDIIPLALFRFEASA